jgi:hypothetical protein
MIKQAQRVAKSIDPIVVVVSAAVGGVVFLFSTFATIGYVDAKHDGVMAILYEIKDSVSRIESRVYELNKEKRGK